MKRVRNVVSVPSMMHSQTVGRCWAVTVSSSAKAEGKEATTRQIAMDNAIMRLHKFGKTITSEEREMKNHFMRIHVRNMKTSLESFKLGLQLSATQDDGIRDKQEKRDMKRLEKAADKFMEELERVMKE